jgi:hypothetical protein
VFSSITIRGAIAVPPGLGKAIKVESEKELYMVSLMSSDYKPRRFYVDRAYTPIVRSLGGSLANSELLVYS